MTEKRRSIDDGDNHKVTLTAFGGWKDIDYYSSRSFEEDNKQRLKRNFVKICNWSVRNLLNIISRDWEHIPLEEDNKFSRRNKIVIFPAEGSALKMWSI